MLLLIFCFLLAFIWSSFIEYWLHRLMHIYPRFGRDIIPHYRHHKENSAQGVIPEFKDYSMAVPSGLLAFLISVPVGISFILGSLVYAIFAAYAHQLQHENPTKCVWLKMPVHYVHHKYNQWDYNFGLAVDWWDKVFGTYKAVDWLTEEELERPEQGYLQLKWW
ncbi:sterol desaturase family protein [Pleurocapsa sp. PCC 7319]|uniref:sterol desaturase family protein n=1 Tax=Pleurocapsa sp. PCC 7319 TaxID=118161 RepID=UPI0003736CC1|nr:sterol desaturase family protein [Pleurocapsa sp. PCC 7319]